jgi:hypothetical protein
VYDMITKNDPLLLQFPLARREPNGRNGRSSCSRRNGLNGRSVSGVSARSALNTQ